MLASHVFVRFLNTKDPNTNQLYTAEKALSKANEIVDAGMANTAFLYGNKNFRLSD